jgi:hypothetical protein
MEEPITYEDYDTKFMELARLATESDTNKDFAIAFRYYTLTLFYLEKAIGLT